MQGRVRSLLWADGKLKLIDQTKLPITFEVVECTTYQEVGDAIRSMKVRGAPAIGATAAFGVALGALEHRNDHPADFVAAMDAICGELAATRPTAVNLFWALERMRKVVESRKGERVASIVAALVAEAEAIAAEDVETCQRIGAAGAALIPDGAGVLTICNAGALATVDYGTALGVVRAACEAGRDFHVYAAETRPFLQGARLTAWELVEENIPATLITDNMAGWVMQQGRIQVVIVGADRIARNGDTANKIGTYTFAVLAHHHQIPFYVAAPLSTVDLALPSGEQIPIEERPAEEVTHVFGQQVAPKGIHAYNPAFDVTPAQLISGIITEVGVIRPPFTINLGKAFESA
ncbi:MAG: S-methyl-5-thioribose-1-phosphate isomerase [Firmicutes bacterium]|nr:S-methyl-5-thioribose-1-phosphate isomerase [Bacillota bacterium]